MMELKKIAILGAGGNVGSAIIKELLKSGPRFHITSITRQTSTYKAPPDSNIQHQTIDYESFDSLVDAFTSQDAVLDCVTGGATQYEPSKRIIDAAIAANVKFFFANEYVGHIEREQYKRLPEANVGAKVRIRAYLEEVGKAGKICWTSLTGGPFFDMWLMKGPAGFDIPKRRARIYGTGENSLCWTPLPIMGLAAANMLKDPEKVKNEPVYICPIPGLTQNKILETLEKVLETKFEVKNVDVRKINEHARIALERGEAGKAMKGLAVSNQFFEEDSGNDFSALVRNEVAGVEMMSVEDAVRDALERYGRDCQIVQAMYHVEPCEI